METIIRIGSCRPHTTLDCDNMTTKKIFLFYVICSGICLSIQASAQVEFTKAESNVSYNSVTELEYLNSDFDYAYGESEFQFGRLWLAPAAQSTSRLVILLHGGCWLNQFDMQHTFPLATALAQEGYHVWSIEYRRTGDIGGGWPGSFDDVKAGIRYVNELSEQGINLENSIIIGHSAGGHLALLAGREFPSIKGVIGLAAITDIVSYSDGESSCEKATQSFMGGSYSQLPSLYRSANPANLIVHPNTLLLHGSSDAIVEIEQAALEDVDSETLLDAGHFDWVHPGTDAFTLLLSRLKALF